MKRTIFTFLLLAVALLKVTAQDEKPYVSVENTPFDGIVVTAYCTSPGQLDSLLVASGVAEKMNRLNVLGQVDEADVWGFGERGIGTSMPIINLSIIDCSKANLFSLDLQPLADSKYRLGCYWVGPDIEFHLPCCLETLWLAETDLHFVVHGPFPELKKHKPTDFVKISFDVDPDNTACCKVGNCIYSSDRKTLYYYDNSNVKNECKVFDVEEVKPFAFIGPWEEGYSSKYTFTENLKYFSPLAFAAAWVKVCTNASSLRSNERNDASSVSSSKKKTESSNYCIVLEFMGEDPPCIVGSFHDLYFTWMMRFDIFCIVSDMEKYVTSNVDWLSTPLASPSVSDYNWGDIGEDRWSSFGETGGFVTMSNVLSYPDSIVFDVYAKQIVNFESYKDEEYHYFSYTLPDSVQVKVDVIRWNDWEFSKYIVEKERKTYRMKLGEKMHVVLPGDDAQFYTFQAVVEGTKMEVAPYFLRPVWVSPDDAPIAPAGDIVLSNEPCSEPVDTEDSANFFECSLADGQISLKGYYSTYRSESMCIHYDIVGHDVFLQMYTKSAGESDSTVPCMLNCSIDGCTEDYYTLWISGYRGETVVVKDFTLNGMMDGLGQQVCAYVREKSPETKLELGQQDPKEEKDVDVVCRVSGLGGGRYSQALSSIESDTIHILGEYHSLADAEDNVQKTTSLGKLPVGDYTVVLYVSDKECRVPAFSEKLSFHVGPSSIDQLDANQNKAVEVYDLQGRRAANPSAGFFVKDGKTVFLR